MFKLYKEGCKRTNSAFISVMQVFTV